MSEPEGKFTETQAEIHAAAATLALSPSQFRRLPDQEAELIYRRCLKEFVTSSFEPRWWWEHLREPQAGIQTDGGVASFTLVSQLVPNPDACCYFIAEDDLAPFYPVYLSTPRLSRAVVGECFGFEYYLVAPDFSWLIGENHHDCVFGVGEPIVSALRRQAAGAWILECVGGPGGAHLNAADKSEEW